MYTPEDPIEKMMSAVCQNKLSVMKAASIARNNGYYVTGFALSKNSNYSVIVDKCAVRWLNRTEWWDLFHPNENEEFWNLITAIRVHLPHVARERIAELIPSILAVIEVASRSGAPDYRPDEVRPIEDTP